ncbi:hypothetical protein HIM_00183 [Hirsutella minnesotensis 3608]|nr:hypothetical protein HIM_00183 [Hirsutella minnesotensis 3608]
MSHDGDRAMTAATAASAPPRDSAKRRKRVVVSHTPPPPLDPPVLAILPYCSSTSPSDSRLGPAAFADGLSSQCDRELPCANCRARNRESACTYEPGAPTARHLEQRRAEAWTREDRRRDGSRSEEPLSAVVAAWGYGQTGASTVAILKQIESADGDPADGAVNVPATGLKSNDFAVQEKYKGLVRQLPARPYVNKLIDIFLSRFNWQYDFVQPDIFIRQLDEWNRLPFGVLSREGPEGLSPDLRVFPAVLFQVAAMSLLLVSETEPSMLRGVKYTDGMTFDELAGEYSEAGATIVTLLGKTSLSVTTVQAEFLRASYLKFTAKVTESWHAIGMAVRDAQELGMHRDSLDPKPQSDSLESKWENDWLIQRRRRMYMLLAIWDINMSIILGRPGTVDWKHGVPSAPIDCLPPVATNPGPLVLRNEERDPPTPQTRVLYMQTMAGLLREMLELEKNGLHKRDQSKVAELHQKIVDLDAQKPAVFRLQDADTRWDSLPEAHWLPQNRLMLALQHQFSLLALHRPYVFHRRESREAAVRASLELLEVHRILFEACPPEEWKNFMMFFGSFDAIVLISSIVILFPQEQSGIRVECTAKVCASIERLTVMQERNPLAKSAQGVLQALLAKLARVSGNVKPHLGSSVMVGGSSVGEAPMSAALEQQVEATLINSWHSASGATRRPWSQTEWSTPPEHMLAAMAPVFPTSDLIYHELTAMQNEDMAAAAAAGAAASATTQAFPQAAADVGSELFMWQFGGDFGQDTVWQMFNQFDPAPPRFDEDGLS